MARGWASKSVEEQIDMAEANPRRAKLNNAPAAAGLDLVRKQENLRLSRTRVARDLESAHNPRYKALLKKALADLDAQLKTCAAG
jgi:hypothetical protein